MEINKFADLSNEEFSQFFTSTIHDSEKPELGAFMLEN
jgi:hypothetical protein